VPLFLSRLNHYGIPRGKISLELTETALLINLGRARGVVQQLSDSGVSISIDDFGAGFTSFSYLRDFAAPEIKLDCSFVAGLEANSFNSSLVRSLAVLCNALGVDFIAEGVEELETWPMLLDLGCRMGQGYSIARPMPGADVLPWLAHWDTPAAMAVH
jgi:diguanylate cyclase